MIFTSQLFNLNYTSPRFNLIKKNNPQVAIKERNKTIKTGEQLISRPKIAVNPNKIIIECNFK